jgi:hypothetical protein
VFYFEQLLQTALNGIDNAKVTSAVLGVAGTILLLSFLYSAYEAFAAGGDVRMLATSGIKYLILGLVFANYASAFRGVNSMFNSVADFIYNSTGVGDLFSNWMGQLEQYWDANGIASLWNLVTGSISGLISLVLILGAFVIFPVSYLIFTVFYAMYGSVLYVTGPFVLALLPAKGLGQISRTYLVNLMVFQAWGLVYAIIQVLMSAVNLSSINAVLNANGVLNSFVGSSQMVLLALTASLFSLSIALIPFVASRIVRGDVGSTMMTLARTVANTVGAGASIAATSIAGASAGAAAATATAHTSGGSAPPPSLPPAIVSSRASGSAPSVSSGIASSSMSALSGVPMSPVAPASSSRGADGAAPTVSLAVSANGPLETSAGSSVHALQVAPVSQPRSKPGIHRGFNAAQTVAWHTGYAVGKAFSPKGHRA